jgi:aryl-alcohol dehydrogenase-like predicted oxidoreductase
MQMNPLGSTGMLVSKLGFGSMGIRGPRTWGVRVVDDAQAESILHAVLDAGINFIDTAPDYGLSEERIGRFLASRKDEFLVATKCGCAPRQNGDHLEIRHVWTKETVQRNIEESLTRLQRETIDLLQFHGGDMTTLLDSGLIDLLTNLKSQGVIRYFGVSTQLPELPELIESNLFDTFQVPYSCLSPEHGPYLEKAAQSGAGLIIRGGIAQGGPDAEIQRPALNQVWNQARLDELLVDGMTRAELLLRFTLSQSFCHTAIIGTASHAHLAENVAAAEKGPLPQHLLAEILRRVNMGSQNSLGKSQ